MRRLVLALPPQVIAALALVARLLPTPRTIDDAFITFRYARNLLAGAGFVFNPGEQVLGTTTPLYTLLMAALASLTRSDDYPRLALIANALADALTCLLLIRLGQRLSGQRAVGLGVSLLWAVAPMSVTFAIGGMETSVFILLLVLSADLYLAGRARWAALSAALLLLTRPDGALLVGPLILDLLWRRAWRGRGRQAAFRPSTVAQGRYASLKAWPWAEAAIFLAALAPWAIFAAFYFGSPIPHSIAAKTLAYRLQPGGALLRLLQNYASPFFEHLVFPNSYLLIGLLIVYVSLSVIGGLHAVFDRDSRAWPVTVYPWLYLAVFAAANPLIFRWYLAPPLPFYFLLILTGFAKLSGDVFDALRKKHEASNALPARVSVSSTFFPSPFDCRSGSLRAGPLPASFVLLPVSFFLLLSFNAWTLHPDHGPGYPAPEMAWHKLELLYTQAGQALAPRITPQTLLAAGDVGALGYYSNARILDTVGLMSPEASAYYPLDPALYALDVYAVPPKLIRDYKPDYVALLEIYGRNGLFIDPEFLAEYELSQKIPTDIYGSDGMLIWTRRASRPAGH